MFIRSFLSIQLFWNYDFVFVIVTVWINSHSHNIHYMFCLIHVWWRTIICECDSTSSPKANAVFAYVPNVGLHSINWGSKTERYKPLMQISKLCSYLLQTRIKHLAFLESQCPKPRTQFGSACSKRQINQATMHQLAPDLSCMILRRWSPSSRNNLRCCNLSSWHPMSGLDMWGTCLRYCEARSYRHRSWNCIGGTNQCLERWNGNPFGSRGWMCNSKTQIVLCTACCWWLGSLELGRRLWVANER